MAFPAEHFGAVKKRTWYKVKWIADPPGYQVTGKYDVLMESQVEQHKDRVEVQDRVETDTCAMGLPVGFGKSEQDVDDWIAKHRFKGQTQKRTND